MQKMTTRRKLAIASWSAPSEGNIYGKLTLETAEVERFLAWIRATHGVRATMTHFVGRCIGEALAASPALNGRIFLGKYIPHKTADLAFLVALEEGADLAKAKVRCINEKSVSDIAGELQALAQKLHRGEDDDFKKSQGPLKILPTWLIRPMLKVVGWLGGAAGLNIKPFGVEAYPFGAAVVTSVGMLGIDEAFVPPTPFAKVPVWVCVGAMKDMPLAKNGELVVAKQVHITATLDHRFIDGYYAANIANMMRAFFQNPWPLEGLEGPPADVDAIIAAAPTPISAAPAKTTTKATA